MLVHICGTWRPENSASIWNLLWLSRRMIICTEQTSIYISTFPNALTSIKATNLEIGNLYTFQQMRSYLRVTHRHSSEIQNTLFFKQSTLLSYKIVNRYKSTSSYT